MNRFLIFLFTVFYLHSNAEVKVENIYIEKKLAGYRVSNDFFRTVIIEPNRVKSDKYAVDAIHGGWFKSIVLTNSESIDLLSKGISPDGTVRYGLAQTFEPLIEIPEKSEELILPGIGRGTVDKSAKLKVTEFFPWRSNVNKFSDDKKGVMISFLQDCDNNKKPLNYKMRIDCIFSDTSIVEIKGVFLNLSNKKIRARVSPTAIFNNADSNLKPWIVVPYQQARIVDGRRINYIDCEPIFIEGFRDYYEFSHERLSKAKRWIAVGGLKKDGVFSIISNSFFEKVVFWKNQSCFSLYPYIKIEAKPEERIEWNWKIIVGYGMKKVNNVSEKGLLGVSLKQYGKPESYICNLQFMPVKITKDALLDILLKSSRGSILSTKSYETFDISPLKPESIDIKLPKRVRSGKRYRLKVEVLKDDDIFFNSEQWIYPE